MERRESATLAGEIVRAPLPVQELFRRAVDLASAVRDLHRQSRVHGGIQPLNIVLSSSGAELTESATGPPALTAYSAPEQFRGVTDERSDIFAFGAVVYEMATGRKAFAGDTSDELKAAITGKQPQPIATLQKDPAAQTFYTALDRVVASCLVKNPDRRRQRIQNVLMELKLISALVPSLTATRPAAVPDPSMPRLSSSRIVDEAGGSRHRSRVLQGAAILGAATLLALAGMAASAFLRKPSSQPGVLRFALPAPEQASYPSSPAISPDGKLLAFSAVGAGNKWGLWIRPLNSLNAMPLANTDDAMAPFWSPDGQSIGFFAGKKLEKIAVGGGAPVVLCATDGLAGGGSWSRDGVIVFGSSFDEGLYTVPAGGGAAKRLTRLDSDRGERAHLWPLFLPDGKHFLFYALSEQDKNGVSVGSLNTSETRPLLRSDTNAMYAEPATPGSLARKGYLLSVYVRRLTAQPFDATKLVFIGEPLTVADGINYLEFINLLPISTSANGLLVYQSIDVPKRQLVWFDRQGNQTGVLSEPGEYGQPRISPDGRQVAVNSISPHQNTADILVFDLDTNRPYRFTAEPTHEDAPVWSPDGKRLVYFSNPWGHYDLFRKALWPSARQELLLSSRQNKCPNDWSADGRFLLFGSVGGSTNSDLWILPMRGTGEPYIYRQTVSSEGHAQFSPDGKWIAYQSDESGRAEVYVEPFPRIAAESKRWQISAEGGGLPKWRGDGNEIYYITAKGKMMTVTVGTQGALSPGAPRMLFETHALPHTWNMFDATPDGRRFLVNTPLEWASSAPIIVVANWTEGFHKR
jgi:Tol biopolymer transport system component